MLALTLTQLFGKNATQSATELIIKKADLVAIGLTPLSNNRAEQLLVALLLQALNCFQVNMITEGNGNVITDENNSPIEYDNSQLYELLEIFRWNDFLKQRHGVVKTSTFVMHSYERIELYLYL